MELTEKTVYKLKISGDSLSVWLQEQIMNTILDSMRMDRFAINERISEYAKKRGIFHPDISNIRNITVVGKLNIITTLFGFNITDYRDEKGRKLSKTIQKLYHDFNLPYNSNKWNKLYSMCEADEAVYYFRVWNGKEEEYWNSGDFGDNGSCFWGDRTGTRLELKEHPKFRALLFFKFKNNDEPSYDDLNIWSSHAWGRCWMWKRTKGGYLLFNFYNKSKGRVKGDFLSKEIASLLGGYSKTINISNHGDYNGNLYLNDGKGYLITEEKNPPVSKFDFKLHIDNDSGTTCDACGEYIQEGDEYWGGDDCYCDDCYYSRYCNCESCQDSYLIDDCYPVYTSRNDYEYWCENCRDNGASYSEYHSRYIDKDVSEYVESRDDTFYKEEVIWSERDECYLHLDDVVFIDEIGWVHIDEADDIRKEVENEQEENGADTVNEGRELLEVGVPTT